MRKSLRTETKSPLAPPPQFAKPGKAREGWSVLIVWAAAAAALLQAGVGVAHLDREALAFAILFAIPVAVLARARKGSRLSTAIVIVLGLLFADVGFWMITATWSNVWNHEQLPSIVEPLALSGASAAGLIGLAGRLLDRQGRGARAGVAAAIVAVLSIFVLGVGAVAAAGWGREQAQGPNDLVLHMGNTAYSTTTLTARSHQITLYVTNDDLFWHTVTIDRLAVDLKLPVGSHRRVTISATPGTYTYYCRIPGHAQAGMKGTVTIP